MLDWNIYNMHLEKLCIEEKGKKKEERKYRQELLWLLFGERCLIWYFIEGNMFIQSVRIKPLSSKGQNRERGRNNWREKGPEGVHVSSTLFLSFVIFPWNQNDLQQYLGKFSEECFPPLLDPNFRTVINYVHFR